MEKILDKKITMSLWKLIAFTTFAIAFITLGIATGNVVVSENFITVIKLITIIVAGSIVIVAVVKILLDKADRIRIFINENINNIILTLIITLVATLLSGCMYQVSIGAMNEAALDNIIIIEFSAVLFVFVTTLVNIIRLFNTKKKTKRKARMKKLASLIVKSSKIVSSNNAIKIQALVTDLYILSVKDITTVSNVDVSPLYNSDTFMSFINENANVTVTKDLGFFKNSLDYLVANHCVSTMEAATAKVVTFYVDRDILTLL